VQGAALGRPNTTSHWGTFTYGLESEGSLGSRNESISGEVSFSGGRTRLDSSAPAGARGSEAWLDSGDEEQQQADQGSSEEEEKEEDVEHPDRWTNAKPLAVGGGMQTSSGGGGGAARLEQRGQQRNPGSFLYSLSPPESPAAQKTAATAPEAVGAPLPRQGLL